MGKKINFHSLNELVGAYFMDSITDRQFLTWVKLRENIKQEVVEQTSFLNGMDRDISIEERCWYIVNKIKEPQLCPHCKKNLKAFIEGRGINIGYRPTCSSKECQSAIRSERMTGENWSKVRDKKFVEWQETIDENTVINDQVIIDNIFGKTRNLYPMSFNPLIKNPYLIKYLENRYDDSDSWEETIRRIKLGIEVKPRCKKCGKPLPFSLGRNKIDRIFGEYCSTVCSNNSEEVIAKKQATDRKNNGGKLGWTLNNNDPEKKRKIAEGWIRNKNIQIGTSAKEKELLEYLRLKYSDIISPYTSTEYPHKCDFFIPSKNLYIEFQGCHFHGYHPFDPTDKADLEKVEYLKIKGAEKRKEHTGHHNHFDRIVEQWTIRDPERRKEVKEKGLNWIEIWPSDTSANIIDKIEQYPDVNK